MTIVEELIAAGIPVSHHESDLYCRDTPQAREIVKRHGYCWTEAFVCQAPAHRGEVWMDVPFAYIPWWDAKARRRP